MRFAALASAWTWWRGTAKPRCWVAPAAPIEGHRGTREICASLASSDAGWDTRRRCKIPRYAQDDIGGSGFSAPFALPSASFLLEAHYPPPKATFHSMRSLSLLACLAGASPLQPRSSLRSYPVIDRVLELQVALSLSYDMWSDFPGYAANPGKVPALVVTDNNDLSSRIRPSALAGQGDIDGIIVSAWGHR